MVSIMLGSSEVGSNHVLLHYNQPVRKKKINLNLERADLRVQLIWLFNKEQGFVFGTTYNVYWNRWKYDVNQSLDSFSKYSFSFRTVWRGRIVYEILLDSVLLDVKAILLSLFTLSETLCCWQRQVIIHSHFPIPWEVFLECLLATYIHQYNKIANY